MFFIVAHQRAGTHLLATLLNSHPALEMYDEPLAGKLGVFILPRKKIEELGENEGAIIMYNQLIDTGIEMQNKILSKPIIHLVRNVRDNARSYWHLRQRKREIHTFNKQEKPMEEPDEKSIQKLSSIILWRRGAVEALLNGTDHITVKYEDLESECRLPEVCGFLGVKDILLRTRLKRANP